MLTIKAVWTKSAQIFYEHTFPKTIHLKVLGCTDRRVAPGIHQTRAAAAGASGWTDPRHSRSPRPPSPPPGPGAGRAASPDGATRRCNPAWAGSTYAVMITAATVRGRGGLPPHLSRCRRPRPAGAGGPPVGSQARPSHSPQRARLLHPRPLASMARAAGWDPCASLGALAAGSRQEQAAQEIDSDRGRGGPGPIRSLLAAGRQRTLDPRVLAAANRQR